MNEIRFLEFVYENGETVISLGRGVDISKVVVRLSDSDKRGSIALRYAQSNVLDVILDYGKQIADNTTIFTKSTPVCATHLFIGLEDTAANIEEIIVYEAEECEKITYPHFFDTDLGALYCLDSITVKADTEGELFYTLYSSADGQSFFLLHILPHRFFRSLLP